MTQKQWFGHPCFDERARHNSGRVHLPVAPKCNIQCKFCDRKYDCVNESRPGVSSVILSPGQAMTYFERAMSRNPSIAVVGIAGPGDPLANPVETLETLRLVRERYPKILLCLATNGLVLPEYVDRIADLAVSHVTVTVNAVDPDIGANVYAWVRDGKRILRGYEAAETLLQRQVEGIRRLKAYGMIVKINFILIPGINDQHAGAVAKMMASLSADIFNCIPLIPSPGSEFGEFPAPWPETQIGAQRESAKYLPQMRHCTRCRADAVGLLGCGTDEQSLKDLRECSRLPLRPQEKRPYTAAATREGALVNVHLGQAEEFLIYSAEESGFKLRETRKAPLSGNGDERWKALADLLRDCRAVLVNAAGNRPMEFLKESGIEVIAMDGLIEQGLEHVYNGAVLPGRRLLSGCSGGQRRVRSVSFAETHRDGCGGNGMGCL